MPSGMVVRYSPLPMQVTTPPRLRRLWTEYFLSTREDTDARSAEYRATTSSESADRQATIVLLTSVAVLLATNFITDWQWASGVGGLLGAESPDAPFTTSPNSQFNRLAWWAAIQIGAYTLLPLAAIRFGLRGRPRDFGAKFSARYARFYLGLLVVSIPFIVVVSYTDGFQAKYPFYDLGAGEAYWPYLTVWWILYGLQFVALEFFFRGFMVHGLKSRFGYMAVIIMVVPYTMIHFRKPLLEAIGAIFGGTILGTMSLKTRSVWWGAALHVSIAGLMDVLSLTHKGLL